MVRKDLIQCEGCGKLTAPEKLSFDGDGRALCVGCYESQLTKKASWLAKKTPPRRRCELCGKVATAKVAYDVGEDGTPNTFTKSWDYTCPCGFRFSVLAPPALFGLGVLGSVAGFLAGLALRGDELFPALIAGAFVVFVVVLLLRELAIRRKNPTVR